MEYQPVVSKFEQRTKNEDGALGDGSRRIHPKSKF
jgi:hypothetical protein